MWESLKQSLLWIHLALFKPISLVTRLAGFEKTATLRLIRRIAPVQAAIILGLSSVSSVFLGYYHNRLVGLVGTLLLGLAGWLFLDLFLYQQIKKAEFQIRIVTVMGFGGAIPVGVAYSVYFYAAFYVQVRWLSLGLMLGLVIGFFSNLSSVFVNRRLGFSSLFILGFPLVLGLALRNGVSSVLPFGISYLCSSAFAYLRLWYLFPHLFQYWRSSKSNDPFPIFQNSPVYWDEAIAMPLPFLSDWLLQMSSVNRDRGTFEIARLSRLPYQRRAAQQALVRLLVEDLKRVASIREMAAAPKLLEVLPTESDYSPAGIDDVGRHIGRVAELAGDYLTRVTTAGQLSVLREIREIVQSFRDAMVLVNAPVGPGFLDAASRWLELIKNEEAECQKRVEPIPNPFVVGNPLMVRDHNLFKGRKDIVVAIEENIINPAQRPALLLYGRRRIGKTSTLLNLRRLISSQFVPVFIDCQDAKWREGDEAFCYHLAASIYDALNQRALVETASRPQLDQFERYAFTSLGEYLDQIEETSRTAHKQILLTFDEYEKLEEGISASKLSTEVLNQLRNIVQHRERIVMLFSGVHRFEEMRTINWSDYLINVKTLELSFLAAEDARALITEPVPLLQFESGVIEQIIDLTHCQPYLLQAVASDMVNYLNSEKRMLATADDLEVAVEKVLVTAQAYFFYTWTADCTEAEREVLRMIATGDTNNRALAEHHASLQSLCHKEILERQPSGYRFSIELFRRWVLKNQTAQPFTPGDLPEPAELEYAAS